MIKDNKTSFYISFVLCKVVSKCVFLDELKHADVKPIYKKESRNEKESYRPARILPNLSKVLKFYARST